MRCSEIIRDVPMAMLALRAPSPPRNLSAMMLVLRFHKEILLTISKGHTSHMCRQHQLTSSFNNSNLVSIAYFSKRLSSQT
mmetsp:Transcript_73801/g.123294  ORF Transcript_73801/g.123294 Transcript_73801/m.123294 type:complete len:81 (+) Transcript_73801:502-744(+)